MSRRERERDRDRERERSDGEPKRHRSGFDRELSPKRSRRDGKPEMERVLGKAGPDIGENTDRDRRNKRQLQDTLPFEARPESDSKVEPGAVSKESVKKPNGQNEGKDHLSDPTEVPRSRSYFQHDERSNAGQVGRSFGRRATEHRLRDSRDDQDRRATNKSATYDSQRRYEKPEAREDSNGVWRHDGFLKMEAEPPSPVRKRPPFREKKIPSGSENANKAATDPERPVHSTRPLSLSEKRDEGDHNPRRADRSERPAPRSRGEAQMHGLQSRERYKGGGGGGSNYRGRERMSERQGYRPGGRGEKWKHDLFDEANKSPTRKNEEDQIAKVEALLAS
uniref:Uncharacterized protein MANES_10G081700 n=2 Tax=Rhizophora mucronata TaxID=61149 RepID=A0A2P2KG75_RHIMU